MSLGVLAEPTCCLQALAQLLWPPRYFGTPQELLQPPRRCGGHSVWCVEQALAEAQHHSTAVAQLCLPGIAVARCRAWLWKLSICLGL